LCTVIFVLTPTAMRYAQEAREGALLIMLGLASTLMLHVAVRRGGNKTWVAYAVIVAMIPPFNVVATYILLPHFLFALYSKRVKPWCFAAIPAVLTAGTMAVLAAGQRATMLDVYVAPPTLRGFVNYADSLFEGRKVAVMFVITAAIFVVMAFRQKRIKEYSWLLALAILPLPLWVVSHVENIFLFRYGLYAVPFFALIAVLVLRRWYVIGVYIVVLATLSVPINVDYRTVAGHGEDFRSLYADIARAAKPGDAIVTDNWMARGAKDYYLHSDLADPLDPHGATSPTIRSAGGMPCAATDLAPYQRVWFVWFVRPATKVAQNAPTKCDPSLALKSVVQHGGLAAELYTRD
jgi:mannosyltransferase